MGSLALELDCECLTRKETERRDSTTVEGGNEPNRSYFPVASWSGYGSLKDIFPAESGCVVPLRTAAARSLTG
jgi:hypothetical protein